MHLNVVFKTLFKVPMLIKIDGFYIAILILKTGGNDISMPL